jgi:hypothetical protein
MMRRIPPLPAAAGLLAHEDGSGFVACYTEDQVRAYAAAAMVSAFQQCARIAEQQAELNGLAAGWHIAAEIRDSEVLADLVAWLGSKT